MIARVGKECCGCTACANICPKNCIRMTADNEGFLYPYIQEENCVNCSLCEKVCPILSEKMLVDNDKKQALAVVHQDQEILMNSSSGGLFTALANTVIAAGGCVFGAAFAADFGRTHHIMAENPEELAALRGSKYMQSDLDDCYPAVRKELSRNRWVLFTGTPCQVSGLKAFLGMDYDKLICIDVICHGTPSSMLWQRYLKNIEEMLGDKAAAVSFRDKTNGWREFGLKITGDNEEIYFSSLHKDSYLRMFLKNLCLRESCYHCRVKEKGIFSDITMGDLWGVERVLPEIDSSRGVSLALIHTEKGTMLFERAEGGMHAFSVDYEQALLYNPVISDSVKRPPERERFFSDLHRLSWNKLERRYLIDKMSDIVRRKISTSLIGTVKRAIFKNI